MPRLFFLFCYVALVFPAGYAYGQQQILTAEKTTESITIDGLTTESFWQKAVPVTVHDAIANIDIQLKAAYSDDTIYLTAHFADATEDRKHRSLVWNSELGSYENGPTREDVFVVKWNMSPHDNDLTLHSDRPYRADVWFWKAHRTDHSGHADDKLQFYTTTRKKNGQQLISTSGKIFYLQRLGDDGDSAYLPKLYVNYVEPVVEKYELTTPSSSRADILAKGVWSDGYWTIEFARKLDTGHGDDLQMDPARRYHFGVSRYEIAGRAIEPDSDQPLYGCGDVGELIELAFAPAAQ
jgi:hypothetical protein